jgi:hypothetical protein
MAKVRERLAVSKQTTQAFYIERFSLKKLDEVEGKEQYWVKISNGFAALENLDDMDIDRAWETIRENVKASLGYYELKKHKPWFDEGCSKLLDPRKQARVQWLQDPSEINGDNLENIRLEASRHFRNKKREYLKNKITELATNSKNNNISDLFRGMNEFKKGY